MSRLLYHYKVVYCFRNVCRTAVSQYRWENEDLVWNLQWSNI